MYKYSIRLIVFVCVLLWDNVFSAEDESLSVTVKPHKDVLLIGEPLYINSSIKNNGKSLIELHYANSPGYSMGGEWADVLISENGETYNRWCSGTLGVIGKVSHIKLELGQELTSEFTILYGHYGDYKKDFVFQEEKPYFVCVEYLFKQQGEKDWSRLRSAPIRIDVTKPKGEDLSLWEKLQTDTKYAEIVQGPEEITLQQDELDRLSDLCERYSKTTYAPYIVLSLGRYYAKKDYVRGVPVYDKEKEEKALVYLDMVHRITEDATLREKTDIILKRLRPTEKIMVKEKGTDIIIKGEGCLEEMVSYIGEETGIEISIEKVWLPAIEKGSREDMLKVEDMMLNRKGKYSFEAKVKTGDKEEMLKIAKSFLREALAQLKLTKKIAIEEREGKLYLVPR